MKWAIGLVGRNFRTGFAAFVMAGLSCLGTAPVEGALIIYNTGVNDSYAELTVGSSDTHWSVVAQNGNGIPSQFAVVVTNSDYAHDSSSQWIWAGANGEPGNTNYTFRQTFDLTGFDFNTASLSGKWGTDNQGEIFLNGVSTGVSLTGVVVGNFNPFHAFTLNSGFVSGLNTLDIVVTDNGPPGGLAVTGLVLEAAVVPAPASLILWSMGGGLTFLGKKLRRGRKTEAAA